MKIFSIILIAGVLLLSGCIDYATPYNYTAILDNRTVSNGTDLVEQVNLSILGSYSYVDGLGYYHISGEVQNTGDAPAKLVELKVHYYDKAGQRRTSTPFAHPSTLAPGQKGVFSSTLGKAEEFDVGRFEVEPGVLRIDDYLVPNTLTITRGPGDTDVDYSGSYVQVYANVTNEGNETTPGTLWVVAQFFDADGNVITYGVDAIGALEPGETKRIGFTVSQPSGVVRIARHEIVVDYSE